LEARDRSVLDVIGYLSLAYIAVAVVAAVLIRRTRRAALRRTATYSVTWIVVLLATTPLLPYAWVGALTSGEGRWLIPAVRIGLVEDGDSTNISLARVLYVSPFAAQVYVVTDCGADAGRRNAGKIAYVVDLYKQHGKWVPAQHPHTCYDAVWSDCGNADDNTFPPYADQDRF
jgi:hypothetical protein